jgi:hypothetical protein
VEDDGDGIMTNLMGFMPMDYTNPNETNRIDNEERVYSMPDGKVGLYLPGALCLVRLMLKRWSAIFGCFPAESTEPGPAFV